MKQIPLLSVLILSIMIACTTGKNVEQSTQNSDLTGDNSKNSVDWTGTYLGTIPCADCEGIEIQIQLKANQSYVMQSRYLGKDSQIFKSEGNFRWDKTGGKITLENENQAEQYLVGENKLIKLDLSGKVIQGQLAGRYILKKATNGITEKYWKLVELQGKKIVMSENQPKEIHLILNETDRRAKGSGGCNSFNGTYELSEGNRIRFSKMATTMMACPGMETESQFFKVLEIVDKYNLFGDTLILNKARMAPLARFEAVWLK